MVDTGLGLAIADSAGRNRQTLCGGQILLPSARFQEGPMATRGKGTFQKRQKEMARKDKQQRKVARRAQRKLDSTDTVRTLSEDIEPLAELEPSGEPQEI